MCEAGERKRERDSKNIDMTNKYAAVPLSYKYVKVVSEYIWHLTSRGDLLSKLLFYGTASDDDFAPGDRHVDI